MSEKEKEMPDAIVLYNTMFEKDLRTVSEHLRNVFKEGELAESAVVRKFRITAGSSACSSCSGSDCFPCQIMI